MNLQNMLPYLQEEEINELYQKIIESQEGSFRGIKISMLLPYLNEKICNHLFMEALRKGGEYMSIAPFVNDTIWDEIVNRYLNKELEIPITKLFCYMDDQLITKIYESVKAGTCPEIDINSMLPYLHEDLINEEFERAISLGDDYKKFLPFISESALHKYAVAYTQEDSSVLDIDAAFPFMSNADIKMIFQFEMGKQIGSN